mgnify:CR=1 FL=1
MKKSYMMMVLTFIIAGIMIGKAFIASNDIKYFLLVFFAVGCGLALLRLFVNRSIKKMKGKSWTVKILFFTVLLGFGLPFQSWFRTEVLFSMDRAYLSRSIFILVMGVVFMTTFFRFIVDKTYSKQLTKNVGLDL